MFQFNPKKVDTKTKLFAATGLVLGAAGIKLVTSKEAQKICRNLFAAGKRAKDSVVAKVEEKKEERKARK
ncbi:MAG: hypothetical protein HUJ84_06170 [Veillonella sp.]|nr:hypothetical protein [Veillonella sp.]MCF0156060.1 hypothetical protein [Veillonella sp.]